jgi:hypothetical protein
VRFTEDDFTMHSGQRKSGAHLLEAVEQTRQFLARPKFEQIPSKGLDALGITQRKLNGNFNSWMDELSDRDKQEGGLWYPTGNDWGNHMAALHDRHPDKVFGVMSKMSPQRDWYGNLDDAHMMAQNFGRNPDGIYKPAGISGTDNLKQSMRVMGAHDDPDSINDAFLGTKNAGGGRMVPRTPRDLPKTHDFYTALRDPEAGGAGNYAHQPAVADSWMSRSMLWSKKRWDDAQNGGKPLTWHGKGTGEGLDKHLLVKKPNPETGKWEVTGTKPPSARDVAARITGIGGGYDRMRQAMQQGAERHNMPFAHGAQAAVWKSISGNANPDPNPQHGDLSEIQHDPRGLWNEQWARRASGLHVPVQSLDRSARRLAAIGSASDPDGPEDHDPLEGWGTARDIKAILRHIAQALPGWDYWEGRPRLGPAGQSSPTENHEDQRLGPHPGGIEASAWYLPERPQRLSWYITADGDGLDDTDSDLKKKKQDPGLNPGTSQSAGDTGMVTPGGLNTGGETGGALPTYRIPSGGGGGMGGGSMPGGSSGSPVSSGTPSSFVPGAGVSQWKQDVDTGLQRNGLPTSLDNQVLHQMETESSGNPNAINNWDSNAKAGHPSQGLMQEIPSTFETHRLPGDADNIDDPQANIDSAIGYAKGTYGPSLMNNGMGMGSGHGY